MEYPTVVAEPLPTRGQLPLCTCTVDVGGPFPSVQSGILPGGAAGPSYDFLYCHGGRVGK